MNIGQAAQASGVTPKMIRYYESIDLIKQSRRTDAGYRTYTESDLHTLRFAKRARKLGFSLEQIRELLSLWQNPERASSEVKTIAQAHLDGLQKRIDELTEMRDTLSNLIDCCSGDQRPECPILGGLTVEEKAEPVAASSHKPDNDISVLALLSGTVLADEQNERYEFWPTWKNGFWPCRTCRPSSSPSARSS